jgi:FtsP/CotA-like multicopper oxidase with cupredoxin domain
VNLEVIPPEVFDICTPTNGSREVIKAPLDKKWLAFDVVSTASIDTFAFSIDEHPLVIYAVDGHYIEPLTVDVINIVNGDRYSVFVELTKKSGDYGIRVVALAPVQVIDTTAILSYGGSYIPGTYSNGTGVVTSTPSVNRGGMPTSQNVTVFDQSLMKSFPPQFPQPAPEVSETVFLYLGDVGNSYSWAMNMTPFNYDAIDNANQPFLYQHPHASSNRTISTKNNTWVDIILIVPQPAAPSHPIHKHSNKMFKVGSGKGVFNWTSVVEAAAVIPQNFNLVDPPYRDGFVTLPTQMQPTWTALRYYSANPGAFLLHCHLNSHFVGGMSIVMLDGVDDWLEVPDKYRN